MNSKLSFLILVIACSSTLLNAQNGTSNPVIVSPKRIVILDDIPYRSGASKSWLLDLAMPENFGDALHPALVIIHGGGWQAGSKRDRAYRSLLLDYAAKGYVAISVEYRFLKEAPFPACIEDVKCAVRWLKAHANQYHVDTSRIGVYGHSAGAHLAMLVGMVPSSAGMEGDGGWNQYSSRVTAVAGGSTPTILPARFGADSARFSPVTYISAGTLPILMMHGTDDNIVNVKTADDFVEKLKAAGAKDVTYERVQGANHGVVYESFLDRTMSAMSKFFERTLKK